MLGDPFEPFQEVLVFSFFSFFQCTHSVCEFFSFGLICGIQDYVRSKYFSWKLLHSSYERKEVE